MTTNFLLIVLISSTDIYETKLLARADRQSCAVNLFPYSFWFMTASLLTLPSYSFSLPPSSNQPSIPFVKYYEQFNYRINIKDRLKRSTKEDDVIEWNFKAHQRRFNLVLKRDANLFTPDASFETSKGKFTFNKPRFYRGHVLGDNDSVAYGIVSDDGIFQGKIQRGKDIFSIEKQDSPSTPMIIYKEADIEASLFDRTSLSRLKLVGHSKAKRENRGNARRKRAVNPRKTTCTLFLQADHLFYERYNDIGSVLQQLTHHVQTLNEIFNPIDFDGNGLPDNIGFVIKKIKINTDKNDKKYKFPDNYGVERFLEMFSEENFDDYCLAYMFTRRDFEKGTLGLAWTGDWENAGGICEKYDVFHGSRKSLNTGVITTFNYGKDVPSIVSHMTFAHEIGHSMGSNHDPETSVCSPGGVEGTYLMYSIAVWANKPNNKKFSKCSTESMSKIINIKAKHDIYGCFIENKIAICGNSLVEEDEECDCGWKDNCREQCCYPQISHPPPSYKACRLKNGATCSPSAGSCCSNSCRPYEKTEEIICSPASRCQEKRLCDGNSISCPSPLYKPNNTLCDTDLVCQQGKCSASICLAYNLEPCLCEQPLHHCHVCCQKLGQSSTCKSSFSWNESPTNLPNLLARPGSPCANYKGYCDVFHKCRSVDEESSLNVLRNFLSPSPISLTMKEWIVEKWYLVLIMAISLIIILAIFMRICKARKTALKLKNKPPTTWAKRRANRVGPKTLNRDLA
ncbi:DgyrCDS2 [Dimorphilus gyrociliatus]|uniref:ADAM10 endopeptidase n=2 Tax=Dimorphilus gyrociliatus TaxID=2664684 RepID=A0A7I8V4V6_9ANNE|nr:DgyrCDS2 [Dimorphilus gyrociliatus]